MNSCKVHVGQFFIWLTAFFCLLSVAPIAEAQECSLRDDLSLANVDEDYFLIAVLRANNRPIAESIEIYQFNNTFLIPVKQLSFLFNLDWTYYEQDKAFYSEYSNNSKHDLCSFSIEFSASNTEAEYYWYEDDYETYIDAKVIANFLQGEMEFNDQLQQLNFSSSYSELGYTQKKQNPIFARYNEAEIEEFPIVRSQYKSFTSPIVNYSLSANQRKNGDLGYRTNLNAYFDVLGLASEARIISSHHTDRQYLKFSKNILMSETDEYQLGNVQTIEDRAIKYEFGDISVEGDELISNAKLGLGAQLFTYSQNTRRNFSNIRIEETALPGWRAILFRNGQFVSEQIVDENGFIVFEDVATFFGVNTFRIHLYGPQGQEEFREKIVHVGNQQKKASEYDFSLVAVDSGKSLFNGSNSINTFDKRIEANASYGLTNNLTVNAQWQELPNNKDNQRFLSTSADYTNFNSLFRLKYAHGADNGKAIFAGVNSNISENFSSNISYRYFDDFDSERYTASQGLEQELQVRVLSRIKPLHMGVNFNFTEKRFVDKAIQRSLGVQTNQFLFGGTFSNDLQVTQSQDEYTFTHRVFTTNTINQWQLRQSLSWEPLEGNGISSYSANLRWPHIGKVFNETKLDYKKNQKAKYTLSHRLSWRADYFNFQVGASVDNNKNWQFKLGISGSLYKSKQSNSYKFARNKGSDSRRIEAIAFVDADRNGVYSEEEEKLQNIEFAGQASWSKNTSNEDGLAELFTRSDYQLISIQESSLENPFLASEESTKIVASHAGSVTEVYFPLSPVNDIQGEVKVINDKNEGGVLGLTMQLVNEEQDKYYYAQTDSQGYFFFPQVPPGNYTLSIDEEQLKRLNISNFENIKIVAPDIGDIISLDIIELVTENLTSSKELKLVSDKEEKDSTDPP